MEDSLATVVSQQSTVLCEIIHLRTIGQTLARRIFLSSSFTAEISGCRVAMTVRPFPAQDLVILKARDQLYQQADRVSVSQYLKLNPAQF